MAHQRVLALFAAAACVAGLAACGGDDDGAATTPADPAPTTEPVEPTEPAPTTEPVEPTVTVETSEPARTTTPLPLEVEVLRDVRYGEDREGFHPPLLDVYSPIADGPWPMVVMFHGGGGQFQNKAGVEQYAQAVAAQGAVVFAPNTGGPSADPNSRAFRILTDPGPECAATFAVSNAADYDADPDNITMTGFSGGANAAALVSLTDPTSSEFCSVQATRIVPNRLVLWEGDYMLAPWWDDVLAANPDFYEQQWIWGHIANTDVAGTWHLMLGSPDRESVERLAVEDPFGSGEECGRDIEPGEGVPAAGGMCNYFELRDSDTELRRAADDLGLFDDRWFTIGEFSLLLEDRLTAADADVTTTVIDGATHNDLTPAGIETYVGLIMSH